MAIRIIPCSMTMVSRRYLPPEGEAFLPSCPSLQVALIGFAGAGNNEDQFIFYHIGEKGKYRKPLGEGKKHCSGSIVDNLVLGWILNSTPPPAQ